MVKRTKKLNNYKKKYNKKQKGGSPNFINGHNFTTGNISDLEVKGIVHITEAVGINVARGVGTNLANFFGDEGFQSKLYDTVKANAFEKLKNKVSSKYIVGNIKMDIETTNATIFCHLIGTVYKH
jgi:hypothetical protein